MSSASENMEVYKGPLIDIFHDLLLRDLLVDGLERYFGGALPKDEMERLVDQYLEEHKDIVIDFYETNKRTHKDETQDH